MQAQTVSEYPLLLLYYTQMAQACILCWIVWACSPDACWIIKVPSSDILPVYVCSCMCLNSFLSRCGFKNYWIIQLDCFEKCPCIGLNYYFVHFIILLTSIFHFLLCEFFRSHSSHFYFPYPLSSWKSPQHLRPPSHSLLHAFSLHMCYLICCPESLQWLLSPICYVYLKACLDCCRLCWWQTLDIEWYERSRKTESQINIA